MPRLIDKLERRLGRFAVPNVTQAIILGQMVSYVLALSNPHFRNGISLVPALVLQGEVWRLVTFIFDPPDTNILFAAFGWYMFFLMGTALEGQWGAFRYNLYLLIGYLATLAAVFLIPGARPEEANNIFLAGSVFLAFAYFYPDFQIYIFFILPVKIKYLAWLTWAGYLLALADGDWSTRATVLAAVANFLIFFGRDILQRMRSGQRRMEQARRQLATPKRVIHKCAICGATEKTHPQMDFRYCSKCAGSYEYCADHLRDHVHIVAPEPDKAATS